MRIVLQSGYALTTEHPASHYQLGVLVDEGDGVYAPGDPLPVSDECKAAFGADARALLAGEFVRGQALSRLWSDEECDLMRRYLSQWANGLHLPPETELRQQQCDAAKRTCAGDTTQGVGRTFWRLVHAQVAQQLCKATNGRYDLHDYTGHDMSWIIRLV